MENEFVSYTQALALKELGFLPEHSFGYYYNGKLTINPDAPMDIDAPLYQQAFRWFREKHNLQHEIINDLGNDLSSIVYVYSIFAVDRSEEYKTYEEAENACLNKLIEICKNKQV